MDSSPAVSENVFYMEVRTAVTEHEPCLIFMPCMMCETTQACSETEQELSKVALSTQNLTAYGTTLEYHCDLGKQFSINSTLNETYTIDCLWDGSWGPNATIPECTCKSVNINFSTINFIKCNDITGTQCANPPIPSPHMVYDYVNGTEINFYSTVHYSCKEGYFFEDDIDAFNFSLMCLPGGVWDDFPEKNCITPDGIFHLLSMNFSL